MERKTNKLIFIIFLRNIIKIMQVIDYTEKAIAVIGETKNFKDTLGSLKGKFNPSLRDPNNKDNKIAGWIFPKTKKEEIEKVINDANSGKIQNVAVSEKVESGKKSIINKAFGSDKERSDDFHFTKEMYLALITRIEKLESENGILLNKLGITDKKEIECKKKVEQPRKIMTKPKEETESEEEESEEEDEPPKKSFLQRRVIERK